MNKKLIIFDLDNTLFQSKESYNLLLAEIFKRKWKLDEDFSIEQMKKTEAEIKNMTSFDSVEDFYIKYNKALVKNLFGSYSDEKYNELKEMISIMKKEAPYRVKLYPYVKETLELLKSKGYIIAILTGTWDKKIKDFSDKKYAEEKRIILTKLLENSGINHLIDKLFLSFDIGVVKPHPDSFNMVLGFFKIDNKEAIMIGDKEEDILASNLNITSILFNPYNEYFGETKPDFEFKDFRELPKIIFGI